VLHLIKLCVGCDSVKDLQDWIAAKLKADAKPGVRKRERNHTTRMVPKRAEEIIDGGSLFWVIRGQILCRERILGIRPFVDAEGIGRCHIALDCQPVLVEPRPYRAFQGWRYLAPADAPRDLDRAAPGFGAAIAYRLQPVVSLFLISRPSTNHQCRGCERCKSCRPCYSRH
jgi:hypothetical protein